MMFHHLRTGIKKERSADLTTRMAAVDAGPSVLLLQSRVFLLFQDKTTNSLNYPSNNLLTVIPQITTPVMVDGCTKASSMSANMVSSRKTITPATLIEDLLAVSLTGSLNTKSMSKILDIERTMVELMRS